MRTAGPEGWRATLADTMTVDVSSPASRLSREALGVPDERTRFEIQRDLILDKVNTLLLPIMRQHDIDIWITMDREYHPDPFAADTGGHGRRPNPALFL